MSELERSRVQWMEPPLLAAPTRIRSYCLEVCNVFCSQTESVAADLAGLRMPALRTQARALGVDHAAITLSKQPSYDRASRRVSELCGDNDTVAVTCLGCSIRPSL